MKKTLFALITAVVVSMAFYACDSKKANKDADVEDTEAEANDEEEAEEADDDATFDAANVDSENPGQQLMVLTKNFLEDIKDIHINDAADAEALKVLAERYKNQTEAIQAAIEEKTASLSEEDQLAFAMQMLSAVSEMEGVSKDLEKEMKRLEKEAANAGLNLDDMDLD